MDKPVFKDLLTVPIKSSQKWADFADTVEDVFSLNLQDPISQIEELRFLLPTQGNEELQKTARLLGFNLTNDVLELSTSNMSKLVTQLALYYESSGTELFIKFIDLVLNAKTEVDALYTENYVDFFKSPQGPLLKDGGTWYKTTHVELAVGLLSSYPILVYGQSLTERIRRLFYVNAPINLVIHKFWFVAEIDTEVGIGIITPETVNTTGKRLEAAYHTLDIKEDGVTCNLWMHTWVDGHHTLSIGN